MIKEAIINIFKGIAMGAANVIPGVSGGTIALITGIFERLINSIKSFNLKALKLLTAGKLKDFIKHTDFYFLISILIGIIIAIFSVAKLFEFLFIEYPVYIWSFFFGLILASVYFVGKTINKWNLSVIIAFTIGSLTALLFTFLSPATENQNFIYLVLCGAVAACSMILPGLSGSFVLILMGNYQLVAIDAINNLNLKVLLPVIIGAGLGILAFSHLLSWLYRKFKNQTIGLLSGFILGSLGIIWPWKNEIIEIFGANEKVVGYDFFLPQLNSEFFIALLLIIAGIISIWLMEKKANIISDEK